MSVSTTGTSSLLRQVVPTRTEVAQARRRLHLKACSILAVSIAGYIGLVFFSSAWQLKLLFAALLVHGCIAAATGIMHDANHHAFSSSRRVNQMAAYTADLLGASSWLWRYQHNVLHHHHTNVMGVDGDIEQEPFARLAPDQEWKPWHRFQHLYMWPLYGFLTAKWLLAGDFVSLASLRRDPRARIGGDVPAIVKMFAGKAAHLSWAVLLPMLFHPWWLVLLVYLGCSWAVGFSLALIFQLAHCVDNAEFFTEEASLTGDAMMRHQLATTVDIASRSALGRWYMGWLMGGLDYQVEHHLAPRLPHTIYPLLASRVAQVCAENQLSRRVHPGFFAAVASHHRWLRRMGCPVNC